MRALPISLLTLVVLAACGGGESPTPATNISLYKSFGSVQCSGGGTSLQAMEGQLAQAGVKVLSSTCGIDGNAYPAVCGAADGRIGIFEVPAPQAQAAETVGFSALSKLPNASKVACQ